MGKKLASSSVAGLARLLLECGLVFGLGLAGGFVPAGRASAAGEGPPLVPSHGPLVSVGPEPSAGAAPLSWKAPAAWKETTPKNAMRKAQYVLPAAAGDPAEGECVVFYFGAGQGGDAKANVDRWSAMFTKADGGPAPYKVSEMKVAGRTLTRMESSGTFQPTPMGFGGEPPPPKPDWMMLGAIVPGSDANWFFRCTGPKKTLEAERAHFDALLASIR
ncbi:MAG TPA: hypothetical protein VFQ07_00345 [Candidatus Polarisedimenticolia bacterium]|nr:hypothetical protein [Candidatus Polarisedimenticolia bacterium]